jgi:hypothetical protein
LDTTRSCNSRANVTEVPEDIDNPSDLELRPSAAVFLTRAQDLNHKSRAVLHGACVTRTLGMKGAGGAIGGEPARVPVLGL